MAIGVNMEGHKEVLGLWISQTEGAKFWLQVVTELKNRGVQDIFIACVDGLKGFPDAIEGVYPRAAVQLCIVHMVRNSLNFVLGKAQKEVAADLKLIYSAVTVEEAEIRLTEFEEKWDKQYKPISQSWRRNWERVIPFFDYPPEIHKVIYTTDEIYKYFSPTVRQAYCPDPLVLAKNMLKRFLAWTAANVRTTAGRSSPIAPRQHAPDRVRPSGCSRRPILCARHALPASRLAAPAGGACVRPAVNSD